MDGKKAFYIYQTFGFPLELTMSELNIAGEEAKRIEEEYRKQDEAHRKKSRTSATKKFKSGLGKKDAIHTKYHTATHLLLAALKKVLNKDIHQMGSNITEERIRFDFNYNKPLTAEQKQKIENWVNDAIEKELEVTSETMKKEEARKNGAETTFWDRYPDVITVYKIWDTQTKKIYSYEACNGPHVKNTRELKELGRFKIIKEESCGSGIRRIKAIFSKT
jgi:alanyl-tRNA synthetase